MDSNNTSEKTGLSTKELAIYIGVPVATLCVAGGLYYYYTKKTSTSETQTKSVKGTDGAPVAVVTPQITSGEETGTPLEIAQSSKSKGNKYFKAGRFEQAIECYTKALEFCPKDNVGEIATFYQNRAAAYEQLKKWQNVADDTSKAIELNPKYTKALLRRARAHEALDLKRDCLEDVTAVCLLEGFQNQPSMILADRILKAIGKELGAEYFKTRPHVLPSPVFVKSYLDSFNKDVFSVDFPENEQTSECTYFKILTHMKNKEYENIVDLCTQEIDNDGKYKIYALLLRGTMYTLMCYVGKAMDDFDGVIQAEDTKGYEKLKIDALIKRGSLKMQEAKDAECYADFDEAIKIDANNANIYHHRGQLYFLTERLSEGQKEFEKAMSLDPNFVAPRIQLGYCLCKIAMQMMSPSMLKEANAVLEETIKHFPNCAEAWSLYGQLLQDQQDLNSASEKLEKAISLAPYNPTTYVYKALLTLQWKQDIEEATKLIRKAIELDDKCDFAYETLATLEVQKGNNEEAVRLFERAIDLVRTEAEMASTFSLLEAAKAQSKVTKLYGITLPSMPGMM
ncbi:mitochondrial import receptor subunit TOM70-like [Hydractinia symbiolongicarpus]|uniref:mitochondrial import receptor subunit TOM70-like n=1 Tax=Hydractinia symbiolongicarpus TaxID=13093 RepID=UPI00254BE56E|nr:mitochondrial import receptor subunit TOM70-like [Hydractinia symbiolongicarpus]